MKFPKGRLIQFAKEPVSGRVKTRLAADVGDAAALDLHCQLVRHTYTRLHDSRIAPVELWVSGDVTHPLFGELRHGHETPVHLQRGGDLGERMNHALTEALRDSDYAVLVGSDCPVIDGAYLDAAFAALENGSDVVIGPAQDGGYVLIGMRQPYPDIFVDMEWGTDTVLARTRERLGALDCNWLELPELWDVDRKADLEKLKQSGFF
jgi:rSAM/selenodomain-associated transferase 1